LNLGSSRIELARGGYKLESVMNVMSIVPHKRWAEPPFIARRGEGIVVYSLIVTRLYYKGSSCSFESPGSSWDMWYYRYVVARHIASGWGVLIHGDQSYPLPPKATC
jgi:hypothetical protein